MELVDIQTVALYKLKFISSYRSIREKCLHWLHVMAPSWAVQCVSVTVTVNLRAHRQSAYLVTPAAGLSF